MDKRFDSFVKRSAEIISFGLEKIADRQPQQNIVFDLISTFGNLLVVLAAYLLGLYRCHNIFGTLFGSFVVAKVLEHFLVFDVLVQWIKTKFPRDPKVCRTLPLSNPYQIARKNRADWLNEILAKLWPHITSFAEQEISAKFPLKGFWFGVTLGTVPPTIDWFTIGDGDPASEKVTLNFKIRYKGNCEAQFTYQGWQSMLLPISGGINEIEFGCLLRLSFNPSIHRVPVVGGVELSLLEKPTLSFKVSGVVTAFKLFLGTVIDEAIANYLVIPNQIVLPKETKLTRSSSAPGFLYREKSAVAFLRPCRLPETAYFRKMAEEIKKAD